MRTCLLLLLTAAALSAAVIRGSVVENQTGHALERATVTLRPVAGGSAGQSVRTNAYGAFEFAGIAAGTYLVSASRLAFAPLEYGQKRWRGAGTPVTVTESDATFLTIRLPRYGAITGAVLDENDIGLPDHEVAVYTNSRPPRLLARARTDDRGIYRLFGLAPGSYLVRSLSHMYDDGGYLPTFYRDSTTVDLARSVDVTLDQQVESIDFHATPGRLYTLAGRVVGSLTPVTVALASDTGVEYATVDSNGNFNFNPMAPGPYELLAVNAPQRGQSQMAAYQSIALDRDSSELRIALSALPTLQFLFEDAKGQPVDSHQLKVLARRKDLAGDAKTETLQVVFDDPPSAGLRRTARAGAPESSSEPIRPVSGHVTLLPGRWEVALLTPPAWCVTAFSEAEGRADGWNEVVLPAAAQSVVKFTISSTPATLTGTVRSGGDPAANIPVFVEPADLEPARRLAEVRAVRANAQGQYTISGLAPGTYRLLATFDYQNPGAAEMESSGAKTVKVDDAANVTFDLDEFVIR